MKRTRGNPNFIKYRQQRITELKKLLKKVKPAEHQRILASFALEHGLRIEKVREYYRLLVMIGAVNK